MIKDLPLKILASPDNFVSTFYNFLRNNSIETFYYSNYSRVPKEKKKGGNLLNSSYKARLTLTSKPHRQHKEIKL